MPSYSTHKLHIWKVWQMFHFCILMQLGREMDMEEDDIKDGLDAMMFVCLRQLMMQRYSVPKCREPNNSTNLKKILVKMKFTFIGMKRELFKELVEMLHDHPIFNHSQYRRGWKQAPCAPTHGVPMEPGHGWEQRI